jgi:uncharacterized protein
VKVVFADTFYWIALTSPDDAAHERALSISRALAPDKIVTTDEVLCEYLAFYSSAPPDVRAEAGGQVADLMVNQDVLVVPQSRESFLLGLELYRTRLDKKYSLVDCISMQTMRREGITEALPMTGISSRKASER